MNIYKNTKVLSVYDDYFIGARGYDLYKHDLNSDKVEAYATVEDSKYALLAKNFLTRRFFRAEITNVYDLSNGDQLCIAKKGIFKKEKVSNIFKKIFSITRGSRPMNLCVDNNGVIYFGEYFANMDKQVVHIYKSEDNGINWAVSYTFKEGHINHIHGLFWDKYTDSIWVATGDRENECIIGYTKDGFKSFQEVFRGGQEYRTTNLFFYKEYIIYATDSQYITNKIKRIDRKTLKITEIATIQGSGIYGGQHGESTFISTTVEPSTVNKDQYAHVWYSIDGIEWKEIYAGKKDWWNSMLFQFGSFLFPNYYGEKPLKKVFFYSRALKKIGGNSINIDLYR